MIVAARAGDGQAEHAAADRVDAIVPVVGHERVGDVGRQALVLVVDGGGAEIARARAGRRAGARQLVGGELQLDEAVVRDVGDSSLRSIQSR